MEYNCPAPHLPKTESPKAQATIKPLVLGEEGLEEKPQSGRGREAQTSAVERAPCSSLSGGAAGVGGKYLTSWPSVY